MTTVRVLPAEIEFEARVGETLMEEARRAGLYWPTTCGGQGECTTCLSEIVSGQNNLADMGRNERRRLVSERGEAFLSKPMRLVCQAGVVGSGSITVTKVGVRRTGA
jgi:2Fe-2S ferredoxin